MNSSNEWKSSPFSFSRIEISWDKFSQLSRWMPCPSWFEMNSPRILLGVCELKISMIYCCGFPHLKLQYCCCWKRHIQWYIVPSLISVGLMDGESSRIPLIFELRFFHWFFLRITFWIGIELARWNIRIKTLLSFISIIIEKYHLPKLLHLTKIQKSMLSCELSLYSNDIWLNFLFCPYILCFPYYFEVIHKILLKKYLNFRKGSNFWG